MGCCCSKAKSTEGSVGFQKQQDAPRASTNDYNQSRPLPPINNRRTEEEATVVAGRKIVIGMFDFKASVPGDVSFKRGDRMVIIDMEKPDWWTVRHLTSQAEGLIPSNYVAEDRSIESEDWFFGKTNRREAEKFLLGSTTPEGTFLIRNSEHSPTGYSLSIKDCDPVKGNHVKHYKIKPFEDGSGFFIATNHTFPTLQALVQAHTISSLGLCHALTVACPKPKPELWDLSSTMQDQWEIDRSEVRLDKKLGSGNFGEVWLGVWKDLPVAVKTLKPGSMSPEAFLEEAAIMKKFRHKHLVSLYAVCSKEEPILIVQEFMNNGALLEYMRQGPGKNLLLNDLVYVSAQIASGLAYLEKHNLIHRDIAARNILVGDLNLVKVCDFGLARVIEDDEYCPKAGGRFPIKWTAPEAIMFNKFTIKSDVWSYGILLMEIFTYGQVPYPGMNTRDVIAALERGYRMPKPTSVPIPDEVYNMMMTCWEQMPERRPTFEFLLHFFEDFNVTSELAYREPDPY